MSWHFKVASCLFMSWLASSGYFIPFHYIQAYVNLFHVIPFHSNMEKMLCLFGLGKSKLLFTKWIESHTGTKQYFLKSFYSHFSFFLLLGTYPHQRLGSHCRYSVQSGKVRRVRRRNCRSHEASWSSSFLPDKFAPNQLLLRVLQPYLRSHPEPQRSN